MDPSARRQTIVRMLCRRGHMTTEELAGELGVSKRTIRRDVEILSLTEPIYTQAGRYGGGVFITNNHISAGMYITGCEAKVIKKMLVCAENSIACKLTNEELTMIHKLIADYV